MLDDADGGGWCGAGASTGRDPAGELEEKDEPDGLGDRPKPVLTAGGPGGWSDPGGGGMEGNPVEPTLDDDACRIDDEGPPMPGSGGGGTEPELAPGPGSADGGLSAMGLDIFTSYRRVPRGIGPDLSMISFR